MSDPKKAVAPNTGDLTEHTVQPDEPWWHPHHLMHHGDKIIGSFASVLVAYLVYLGVKKKLKK